MNDAAPFSPTDVVLEHTIRIDAPVELVWQLVSDPRRLSDWSPTVRRSDLAEGDVGAVGSRYVNHNQDGVLEWTTHSVVTRSDALHGLSFRVEENWSVWSFDLTADGDGTRVTQRRRIPDGISPLALELTDAFMGGQSVFNESLVRGMAETLDRIKTAAESPGDPRP